MNAIRPATDAVFRAADPKCAAADAVFRAADPKCAAADAIFHVKHERGCST
jgi:hypothetical protein